MLRDDPAYAEKAKRVSAMTKDVTEYLADLAGALADAADRTDRGPINSACSMQHGQQIRDEPKKLLKAMGFVVKDVPEGHICCGFCGHLQHDATGTRRAAESPQTCKYHPDTA